jgi:hypothetical protein
VALFSFGATLPQSSIAARMRRIENDAASVHYDHDIEEAA